MKNLYSCIIRADRQPVPDRDGTMIAQSKQPWAKNEAPGIGKYAVMIAVVAVLMATLWPYDPFPPNGVTWLHGTRGLKFEKAGLVISNECLKPPPTEATESYSLELLLRPASTRSAYPILTFYTPTRPRQLWLLQYEDGLLVTHDPSVESDRTRTKKFDVDHVFRSGTLVLVTISSGPNGTTVYRDGRPVGFFPGFRISRNELSGTIIIGTAPETYRPWSGELRGLTIYLKELTPADVLQHYEEWVGGSRPPSFAGAIARYAFAEGQGREIHNDAGFGPRLEIPEAFSVPHKDLLRSVRKDFKANWNYAEDVLMNVAGFVPLGLIVCAYFALTSSRLKAILITTTACGLLSLVIEVLQYYIPRRGSGVTDIVTNALGGALGAALTQVGAVRQILKQVNLMPRDRIVG